MKYENNFYSKEFIKSLLKKAYEKGDLYDQFLEGLKKAEIDMPFEASKDKKCVERLEDDN